MAGKAGRQALASTDVALNWIAFDHVAALLEIHMVAQYVGATQIHIEPGAILTNPLAFISLISRHRVTLAFAPNFLLGQINAILQSQNAAREETGSGRFILPASHCHRRGSERRCDGAPVLSICWHRTGCDATHCALHLA